MIHHLTTRQLLSLPCSFAFALLATPLTAADSTTLVADSKPRCAIVTSPDALSQQTAKKLADYLNEHTGAKPSVSDDPNNAEVVKKTLIVIDGTPSHPHLSKLGITLDVPTDRDDAYHLRVVSQSARTIVAIAGHSPSGAKFGTYRLMEEMDLRPGTASIPQLDLKASPFFRTRSASLFNIWRVPVETIRQCNLESWPVKKIQRNVDMYDAFGFNALETHDRFHEDFLKAVYGITRQEWRTKVWALCDRAHEDGMTVFLRQWGNSVALPVKELKGGYTPFGYNNLAPDIPEERARWNAEIRDYCATNYATHIDHLIGHWADASGIHEGSHATIKDALLLHNDLVAAFRSLNPKIQSSFNLWNMDNPRGHRGWPGYVDYHSVTEPGILPKDVIIAQWTRANSRGYSQKETDNILADGYRAAVWTWRRGDTEVRLNDPGLRIRIHGVMADYFHGLPPGARNLEWHNIERNHHGLANDVNYYVASKLMWDPNTDVDAALTKYCGLVFGADNARAVAGAFLAIEASRDVENQVSKSIIANPVEGATRARRALAAIDKVSLSPTHHSRLPSVTTPEEMLKELRGSLTVIAENADLCATELPAIDKLVSSGKTADAQAHAAVVEKKIKEWSGTVAGGVEGMWLKETLEARLSPETLDKTKKWFGFQLRNVETFQEKDAHYVVGAAGQTTATALLDLIPPARRRVEFHFQAEPASTGRSHNAGLAFGPALTADELIHCQALLGGRELRLRGKNLVKPVTIPAPNLSSATSLDCSVSVELDQHRVTFKVGEYSASAELQESVQRIAWYGYVVEKTQTTFGRIDLKGSE